MGSSSLYLRLGLIASSRASPLRYHRPPASGVGLRCRLRPCERAAAERYISTLAVLLGLISALWTSIYGRWLAASASPLRK